MGADASTGRRRSRAQSELEALKHRAQRHRRTRLGEAQDLPAGDEPELHGQPPRSLGKDLWAFGQALIRPDDVHHGVDEREVSERLREVAQVASAVRLDLLGVEQQRAGVGEQLLAKRPGPVQLADLGERRNEPERADRERPSSPANPSSVSFTR